MDCPPPPPAYVMPSPTDPYVHLPQPTARWLALRDVYADEVSACYLDASGRLRVALAERDALRLDLSAAEASLAVADARTREWQGIARRRPSWGLLVGASLVVGLGSVVAWEAVR